MINNQKRISVMTRARDLSKIANSQAFSVDSDFQVGINSTVPAATLDVRGDSVITGILTATSFSGTVDATGLTGSPSITVTDITASGNVSIAGTLTYEDVTNIDAVGVITARSDVSIADKIIHTGDTNTAIRFPAADTFTVETAGSEALRIDSSGRLLLGTTTEGQAFADDLTVATSSNTGITIRSGSSEVGSIYFSDDTSGPGEYDGFIQYNHSTRLLQLGSAAETRLRIDSSGNVAIGTATAGGTLHVENSGELNAFFEGKASTLGARILLKNNDNTANAYNDIEGVDAGGQGTSAIRFINVNDGNNEGALAIRTRASGGSMAEALRITSAGNMGLGTDTPTQLGGDGAAVFHIAGDANPEIVLERTTSGTEFQGSIRITDAETMTFAIKDGSAASVNAMVIDSSGRMGLGTNSPGSYVGGGENLVIEESGGAGLTIATGTSNTGTINFADGTSGDARYRGRFEYSHSTDALDILTAATTQMRITSGGQVRIGSFGAPSNKNTVTPLFHVDGSGVNGSLQVNRHTTVGGGGSQLILSATRGSSITGHTILQDDDGIGTIEFVGSDGGEFVTGARIQAVVDGAPGDDDMPARLIFSTTNDGQNSPTERMRIDNLGNVTMATISGGQEALTINRATADGTLISFQQAGTVEGNIAVSGSTVSYNGAHLTRWSQLPGNAERITILRGTVLSNIDEMCEWGDEDNEQLNRTKVSEVEGDPNVAGVFQSWDDSDEVYTNDFYCAMTGDFIIRIAQGTTVARGDLLMSAGDGTAKPQGDDIVRSKTIAKVTSTTKSVTYSDGSYCVPCVLMAC